MAFGALTDKQAGVVAEIVVGREIHDLGAGDLTLAYDLIQLGARSVVCIDKEPMPPSTSPAVSTLQSYFNAVRAEPDIAFLSWPVNRYDPGRDNLICRSRIVIYLGKNTDGSSCGNPVMFRLLARRELLAYVPARKNTLIIVGPKAVQRELMPEECVAITGVFTSYDETESLCSV